MNTTSLAFIAAKPLERIIQPHIKKIISRKEGERRTQMHVQLM